MPTYDYECRACGHAFEKFQSITADPVRKCPTCGENKVRRLIGTGGAVIFKGSGFYATDYRSESYKSAAKADSESPDKKPAKGSGGDSKKTTAKSETPSAKKSGDSDK